MKNRFPVFVTIPEQHDKRHGNHRSDQNCHEYCEADQYKCDVADEEEKYHNQEVGQHRA